MANKEPTVAMLLKVARKAYNDGNYEAALKVCGELSNRGSSSLEYLNMIGDIHANGYNGKTDYSIAYTFYNLTASAGSAKGKAGVAKMKTKLNATQIADAEKETKKMPQTLKRNRTAYLKQEEFKRKIRNKRK